MKKIVYLSKSPMKYDSRVRNIARSLSKNYQVTVIAEKLFKTIPVFNKDIYDIIRIPVFTSLYAKETNSGTKSAPNSNNKSKRSLKTLLKNNKLRLTITKLINSMFYHLGGFITAMFIKPHLIIARDPNSLLLGFVVSKILRIPFLYDSHEIWEGASLYRNSTIIERKYWDFIEAKLIKKAKITFHATEARKRYAEEKYSVNNIRVLRNTSFITEIKKRSIIRENLHISKNDKILIYQGQISFLLGVQDIVRAMVHVENAVMVFMGMGKDVTKLKELVSSLNLDEKVYFIDPVKPNEVVPHVASADIGIQPFHYSLNRHTGLSIKLLECIMAGIACVGVNFPEISNTISENKIGNTFESENIEQLANAINDLVQNPAKLEECKNNSLSCRHKYAWEVDEKVLLETIGNLI